MWYEMSGQRASKSESVTWMILNIWMFAHKCIWLGVNITTVG